MKKQVHMLIALVALIGFVEASATAQTGLLTANIPFEFSVGSKTLPAGEYAIKCTNPASDLKVLQLLTRDGRTVAMVQTNTIIGKVREDARLVFNRYGSEYFFSQAWLPNDEIGLRAPKGKAEKATVRRLAGMKSSTETVTLKAR